jgi:hypothetical protein
MTRTIVPHKRAEVTPLRIPARPRWQTVTRQVLYRVLSSTAVAALTCLLIVVGLTLIGAGR